MTSPVPLGMSANSEGIFLAPAGHQDGSWKVAPNHFVHCFPQSGPSVPGCFPSPLPGLSHGSDTQLDAVGHDYVFTGRSGQQEQNYKREAKPYTLTPALTFLSYAD